jgi:dTDP-4-dehydrorhamnose reductase
MTNLDNLVQLFEQARPEVVINCVGLVKQLSAAADPVAALMVNAIMPHRLARLCGLTRARLIHISTDCVFSGQRGMYTEEDRPDAYDLYGRSKLLGEVSEGNVLTLRTSIIGPELDSNHGLFSWFLAQRGVVSGFRRAIFSGLPTVVLAQVIHEYVLAHEDLRGLYHVSAAPISKYELLELISRTYSLATRIEPKDEPVIDRSLDSHRFRQATGYDPLPWPQLIEAMKRFN